MILWQLDEFFIIINSSSDKRISDDLYMSQSASESERIKMPDYSSLVTVNLRDYLNLRENK
jgi:hypothetical protein